MTVLSSSLYCFNSVNRLWRKTKKKNQVNCEFIQLRLWESDIPTIYQLWSHIPYQSKINKYTPPTSADKIVPWFKSRNFIHIFHLSETQLNLPSVFHVLVRVLDSECGIKRLESRVNLVGKQNNIRQISSDPFMILRWSILMDICVSSDTLSWKPVSKTASLHPFS